MNFEFNDDDDNDDNDYDGDDNDFITAHFALKSWSGRF